MSYTNSETSVRDKLLVSVDITLSGYSLASKEGGKVGKGDLFSVFGRDIVGTISNYRPTVSYKFTTKNVQPINFTFRRFSVYANNCGFLKKRSVKQLTVSAVISSLDFLKMCNVGLTCEKFTPKTKFVRLHYDETKCMQLHAALFSDR